MKKTLIYLSSGILGIVVLAVIGVTILVTTVNPNRFKPMIIESFNKATNRDLSLDGNISWTIYPNLGLKIENMSIASPKEFGNTRFLQVKSANVAVSLIPLLTHKITFKQLDFMGMNLTLLKKGNLNNWTFAPKNKSDSKSDDNQDKKDMTLSINSFSLTNSSFTYKDLDKNITHKIDPINLVITSGFTGGITLNTLDKSLAINGVNLNFNNEINGEINLDVKNFDDPHFISTFNFDTIKVNSLLKEFNLSSGTNLALLNNVALKSKISGDSKNFTANADFNFNQVLEGDVFSQVTDASIPTAQGKIVFPHMDLTKIMPQLGVKNFKFANPKFADNVRFSSDFVMNGTNLNFPNLQLRALDSVLNGFVTLNTSKSLTFTHDLNINSLDVSNISNINGFKLPLKNIQIKGNGSLAGKNKSALANLNGRENITIQNISLIGFDLTREINNINAVINEYGKDKNTLSQIANSQKLNQKINKIKADLKKATGKGPKNPNLKTNLGAFNAQANIANGVANPSTFNLSGPDIMANGHGKADLGNQSLNYDVKGKLITKGLNPVFQKVDIGANISGKFSDPQVNLDWAALFTQLIDYTIKANATSFIDKAIKQSVQQKIGDALHNLFGGH